MSGPRNSTTRGSKRLYSWRNESFWSVTTILSGGVPKPALLPWGIKSVAETAISSRNVVTEMLKRCETPDDCIKGEFCGPCIEAVKWLKGAPYAKRDAAAELGTYVHNAVEAHALGKPFPKWPLLVKPRMDAFVQFLADYKPEYHLTEASVYNRTQHYAGTLDAIVTIHGRKLVIDVKTGGKDVYPETALQLAAYRYAEFIGLPDGSEEPMWEVDGAAVLHLPADGGYSLVDVRTDEDVFRSFLYAREVFRWQEETSKSVILGTLNDLALTATAANLAAQEA